MGKVFVIRHDCFDIESIFSENDPPKWLISKEYEWFWKDHILKMEVGKSIRTDFQEIERIE